MTIKVAHVTEAWIGGIATYVNALVDYQSKSNDFTEISLIYASNRTNVDLKKEFANNSMVKLYHYKSSRNPTDFLKISNEINNLLQKIQPDIVHLHSTFPGVYGRLKKDFPTVYCPHCWSFSQDTNILKKYIYATVEKLLAKRTDAIINISRNEYNDAKKFNVQAKLNPIILNGVADVHDSIIKPNIKINKNYINIGFIGRLDYQKGFDIIEPLFRNLGADNVKLYVIGEAERGSKNIYSKCENITYLGWVDNKEIDSYIKMFDAVIVPSRHEGFGLIMLEVMRNSKPLIVSNRTSLPEIVIDGYNGYIFDLDNTDNQLTNIITKLDKKSLVKMGENARNVYLSNFTVDRFANEITQLYQEIL